MFHRSDFAPGTGRHVVQRDRLNTYVRVLIGKWARIWLEEFKHVRLSSDGASEDNLLPTLVQISNIGGFGNGLLYLSVRELRKRHEEIFAERDTQCNRTDAVQSCHGAQLMKITGAQGAVGHQLAEVMQAQSHDVLHLALAFDIAIGLKH